MIKVRDLQLKRMLMLFAVIFFFVGCVPERKIGSEYLSQRSKMTLVIRAPELIKMVNLSADSVQDRPDLSQRALDSINFYNSKILQNITDSIVIGNYVRNLQSGFESQGYKTMIVSKNDTVFPVTGNAILINIGQIELDEQKYPIRDETKYNGKLYTADYDLTKIELSYWIEVSKIDNGYAVLPPRLLYDSFNEQDDFKGDFLLNRKTNKLDYKSAIEGITTEYVYSLASSIGSDHAIRLNKYLLNEYISYALPQKKNRMLLGVKQPYNTLIRVYEPSFKDMQIKSGN